MKAYQYRMGEPIAALQIVDLIEQDATPPPAQAINEHVDFRL
jgi:hypothetical protein